MPTPPSSGGGTPQTLGGGSNQGGGASPTTNVPVTALGNDEDDEVRPSLTVWDLDEQPKEGGFKDPKKQKADTDATKTADPPEVEYDYYWSVEEGAKIPEPKSWAAPSYFLLYQAKKFEDNSSDSADNDRKRKIGDDKPVSEKKSQVPTTGHYFIPMNELLDYCDPDSEKTYSLLKLKRSERNLILLDENRLEVFYHPPQLESVTNPVDSARFFQNWHEDSNDDANGRHPEAELMNMIEFPGWTKTIDNDQGYLFSFTNTPEPRPSEKGLYIKLAKKDADLLWLNDSRGATRRGISSKGIYVAQETMTKLCDGYYPFEKNCYTIPIREATGRSNYMTIDEKQRGVNAMSFWQKAKAAGLVKQEGKAVRSRNVNPMKLLFVITPAGTAQGVDEELLTRMVKDSIGEALIPIKQTAEVVVEGEAEATEKKKLYPLKLSISPFGDYETWIKTEDYIAYLKNYPGYPMPDPAKKQALKDEFTKMQAKTKPTTEAGKKNKLYSEELEKIASAQGRNAQQGGVSIIFTSDYDVAEAGLPGARAGVAGQGVQMGGTATTWLHRAAFSWGNEGGIHLASVNTNFVFGSGEANGLMTRFEKAWQGLFKKERSLQKFRVDQTKTAATPYKLQKLTGILTTDNTPQDSSSKKNPIREIRLDGGTIKRTEWYKGTDNKITKREGEDEDGQTKWKDAVDQGPDYDFWDWVNSSTDPLRNMSFHLNYQLKLNRDSDIHTIGQLSHTFYPFQRGFFTRLEADVDFMLLEEWLKTAKGETVAGAKSTDAAGYTQPSVPTVKSLAAQTQGLKINALAGDVNKASNDSFYGSGSPMVASTLPPSQMPQAEVWRAAVAGQTVEAGGAQISDVAVVMADDQGYGVKIPLDADAISKAASTGEVQALVSEERLTSPTPPANTPQNAATTTTIQAPRELKVDDGSSVPKVFVLSGNVKLFGKFDSQIYSYYGDVTTGLRQVVPLVPGTVKISDYLSSLAGSDLESVQLEAVEFVYNQFTTPIAQAGTWLQADVLFSGVLQPVSDVLRDVFHQDKPKLRLQALLSRANNWARPIQPSSFALRGSLPGISVKFGELVEFTELGLSVNVGRRKDLWPPYTPIIEWGVGFFGSCRLATPNQMADLTLDFSLNEYAGFMTLLLSAESTCPNFFGITGLHLSNLNFSAAFAVGLAPESLALMASASLKLRDTTLLLSGHYTKQNWGFVCQLEDFDFASLRDMYEDLFGSQLHISDHDVVLDNLVLKAGSDGILVSGAVTIEGYTSAEATISISSLGLSIRGQVEDIPLAKDVILREASFDIFIGPKRDTAISGPGTSFRFAINGQVSVGKKAISASLFIAKTPDGRLIWTVYGAFQGAVSLSKIAPPLENTFLDLVLTEACFIASNVDGVSAAGTAIPAYFPVVKGVQVAARLSPLSILDSTMNNKTASAGMTLQAIYREDTSAFSLAVNLATPQTMSMKGSNIWSGPVSLSVDVSATPKLMLKADFFVRVEGQVEPLKFSGGLKMSITEAQAYIELVNQWWVSPLGLSPQLRIGPNLALQLGIVYAGPIYPSEIGIIGGLAFGDVSGAAALSISETPNDQLIMLKIQNLGIRDIVDFASSLFEVSIPKPDDFLRFNAVDFYLSTGTTIGTIYYPPGASFSCDAVLFGKRATIYCGVNKSQRLISVKGSLDPIDVGPVSISGYVAGTKAAMDVTVGASQQSVYIDGGIRIGDLDARVYLIASFLPSLTFNLKADLSFSTHLVFKLEASMRKGSFTSMTGLQSLEFDIHCLMQQDILDFVIAQVNMQIMAAKQSVDAGISSAQNTLDAAQKRFESDINSAQAMVDDARRKYELKVAAVSGAFAAEKTASDLQIQKLQKNVEAAFVAFNGAVDGAKRRLDAARQNRENAIRSAQNDVDNAKRRADADIDNHIKQVNDAKNDMQRRFGNAINDLNSAQGRVNSCQSDVNNAQREYDDASSAYDHCKWYEKATKLAAKGAAYTKLQGMKAGLAVANGVLDAAKAVVQGPGYSGAKAAIAFYEQDLAVARRAAEGALSAANSTLQATINAQNSLVADAERALNTVQTAGKELQDTGIAQRALAEYQAVEAKILSGLQSAVDGLAQCAEKIAFDSADAALKVARANVKDVDIAKAAVEFARTGTDAVLDAGNWVVQHAFNILNIRIIEITGDLRGLCKEGTKLQARIVGTFAEQAVELNMEFLPAKGEEMCKEVFRRLIEDVKGGVLKIKK
ncbi:MAG: hypothetical protein LQ350_008251 [Teloschistes chrysophthalmus]|nr:MAG: hypothetical protein LQ350_008251 [Niorma chrysophthalma]